ncbi:MAG TPA: hypothetical protein VE621_15580 [Bryobacteraceae bacterium]|nr:hypothetical protein [Bryobacteraceae bacterium]
MHTRRLAAFLIGAWLMGMLVMGYTQSHAFANVDRILSSPPGPVAKDIEDMGTDIVRMLLRYEASELMRFLAQVWGVLQIGLGFALLLSSLLTPHRSRFIIILTALMLLMTVYQLFRIQPSLNALGRSLDFLPATAAQRERDSLQGQVITHGVLDVLKGIAGIILAFRLIFDRYNWQDKLIPKSRKELRRRKHRSSIPVSKPSSQAPAPVMEHIAEGPASKVEESD